MSKIGIYRMISPSGKIYIGQSIDIHNRKGHYKNLNVHSMGNKIKNSLKKYGFDAHSFDIIQECPINELNQWEAHWKIYYLAQNNGNWSKMLFCELYDKGGGPRSEKTKHRISEVWKNKSQEEKDNINSKRGLGNKGKSKPNGGRKQFTALQKLELGNRSYYKTEEFKDKLRKPKSLEFKINHSQKMKGKNLGIKRSNESKKNMSIASMKAINQYDNNDNLISKFNSLTEAAEFNNISISTVSFILNNKTKKPKFNFKYFDND